MENELLTSGYVFNQELRIWARPGFSGIDYSDGDEAEQRIASIIDRASDISILSTELRLHITDWASLYHLSGMRANIMRPFENFLKGDVLEIGAGCGAITRYLGECGANVLAIEGSPRRAGIARSRTRDLENVTVLSETFAEFQSDYQFEVITLIGVLEYANLFVAGEDPPLAMLKRVRSLLKPEGLLIIAIENQLGLKYFSGAMEDHFGQPMVGIEGRYRKDKPQTFGRKVLMGMLEQAGFAASEVFVPFPDYKLPVSILTEEGLSDKTFDMAALAWQSARRDPQLPVYCNFSLELAWPEIFRNGLGLDLANSFLIISSSNARTHISPGALAYHYTVDRIPAYCKETLFVRRGQRNIRVEYRRLGSANEKPEKVSDDLISFICPESDEYVSGKPLSLEFIQIVTKDGWSFDEVARFVKRYLSIVKIFAKAANVMIDVSSPYEEVSGVLFDVIPQNIIMREDGSPTLVDKEWQLAAPIEVGHLAFRALVLLINFVTRFGRPVSQRRMTRCEFIDGALARIGLNLLEGDYVRYVNREAAIQQCVTGRGVENFMDWGKDQPLRTLMWNEVVAELNGRIAELNKDVSERDGQILSLNQTMAELNGSISYLETGVKVRDERIRQLDTEVAVLVVNLAENKKAHSAVEADFHRSLNEIREKNERIYQQDAYAKRLRGEFDVVKKDLEKLRLAYEALLKSRTWRFTSPVRHTAALGRRFRSRLRSKVRLLSSQYRHLVRSGLFDSVFYLDQNPDITRFGIDPLFHYIEYGAGEGRDPNPLFDTSYYLEQNPDVAESNVNPLFHYLKHGAEEGRDPNPLFDTSYYLEQNPDVAESRLNPLLHYLKHGAAEGRDPNPLFDTSYYLEQNPDVAASGANPLFHYLKHGASEGRDPNPLFDTSYYLEQNPDVAESGTNPLFHYLKHGSEEGRDPNPLFDS